MQIITTDIGAGCTHNTYDNEIHEFVFSAATRDAVDTWVDFNLQIYAKAEVSNEVLILFDSSQTDQLPLGYIINRVKVLLSNRPQGLITKTALVVSPNPVNELAIALTNNILRVHQLRDEVKLFLSKDRVAAIAWLLQK